MDSMGRLEVATKIIGALAFMSITVFKVIGGDVDITWLAIPAVIMASNDKTVDKIISIFIKK
jgi:hypothetical protein